MLHAITLDGFRSFALPIRVEIGKLTVLAGANNAGKSSVVHALMALMQSEQQLSGNTLLLSGDWVELGSFNQTANYGLSAEARRFSIGLTGVRDGVEIDTMWTFVGPSDPNEHQAVVAKIEATIGIEQLRLDAPDAGFFRWLGSDYVDQDEEERGGATLDHPGEVLLVGEESRRVEQLGPLTWSLVHYLGAFRDRPRGLYSPRRGRTGPSLGAMGEYTAEVLFRTRNYPTDVLPTLGSESVENALGTWWRHVFGDGLTLRSRPIEAFGTALEIDTPSAERLGLGQVGLGLSQTLPVITLGLLSNAGSVVVVESPEIHLHPGAQHRLCDLFVTLARSGRQVILETHSEHIVNALRLAVKRGVDGGGLAPEDVVVHNFSQVDGDTRVQRVNIDRNGRLENWPNGFFDQAAQAMLELLK